MRGDHYLELPLSAIVRGTSPHARGPRNRRRLTRTAPGNIPACAGTTRFTVSTYAEPREHPRMRGDHPFISLGFVTVPGTSPHARGPQYLHLKTLRCLGNIPACAGTTKARRSVAQGAGEHPRMRGDHIVDGFPALFHGGTSPHARGPPERRKRIDDSHGNIPACAGTTQVPNRCSCR